MPDLPEEKRPRRWLWRLATGILAAAALLTSFSLVVASSLAILWLIPVLGLAALVLNIVAIRRAAGAGSKWLLAATIPVFMWTAAIFILFGIFFPVIGSGVYNSRAGGYQVTVPDGYKARVDTVHGALLIARGLLVGSTNVTINNAPTDQVVVSVVPASTISAVLAQAEQTIYNMATSQAKQQGGYISEIRHISPNGSAVFATVSNRDGRLAITGSILVSERNRFIFLGLNAPAGTSTADVEALFNAVADSIRE
jgi:energy-coupling factor transporter transmembrane protein EcfT